MPFDVRKVSDVRLNGRPNNVGYAQTGRSPKVSEEPAGRTKPYRTSEAKPDAGSLGLIECSTTEPLALLLPNNIFAHITNKLRAIRCEIRDVIFGESFIDPRQQYVSLEQPFVIQLFQQS